MRIDRERNAKQRLLWAAALILLALALTPLPWPPTESDRIDVASKALEALFFGKTVETAAGSAGLEERRLFLTNARTFYINSDAPIPDALVARFGLKRVSRNYPVDYAQGDRVVIFTFKDYDDSPLWFMRFEYLYGSQGGCTYSVRLYKSLAFRRLSFVFLWMA